MAPGKAARGGKNKPSKYGKKHPNSFAPRKPNTKKPKTKNAKTKNPKKNKIELKDNHPVEKDLKVEKPIKTVVTSQILSPTERRKFFVDQFQSANGIKLSSLELESFKGCFSFPPLFYIFFIITYV